MAIALTAWLASAIAALCFKRGEANTAAAAEPGPRAPGADRWSEGKVFDELRNIDARLAALRPVVRQALRSRPTFLQTFTYTVAQTFAKTQTFLFSQTFLLLKGKGWTRAESGEAFAETEIAFLMANGEGRGRARRPADAGRPWQLR